VKNIKAALLQRRNNFVIVQKEAQNKQKKKKKKGEEEVQKHPENTLVDPTSPSRGEGRMTSHSM